MLFYSGSCLFFFFKQKTAYEMRISDWSSDVCSSDLFLLAGSEQFIAWHGQAAGRNLRRCGLQLRSCIDLKAGEEGSQLRSTSKEKLDGQSRGQVRLGCVD